MIYDCIFERSDSALNPFEMLYDYHFEMSDSDHDRFEMIYLLSFRNERSSSVFVSI